MTQSQKEKALDIEEMSQMYEELYGLIADLKHFVFSATHLQEMESLAVDFSRQVKERHGKNNAIWLVLDENRVTEVAINGEQTDAAQREMVDVESFEAARRIIREGLVIWPSQLGPMEPFFSGFQSPVLFPIKGKPGSFGFLAVENVPPEEIELYQFVGHFAGLIFNISSLYQTVLGQKKELAEMTDLLFEQNAQLTSLHDVGVQISKAVSPNTLCRFVVETTVSRLGATKAATFVLDNDSGQLTGISAAGEFQEIDGLRFPPDQEKAIQQSLESKRIVTHMDYPGRLQLGSNRLKDWIIVPFKGRDRSLGILAAEVGDKDISDSISIMVNQAGMVLDTLMLLEERKKYNELLSLKTTELSRANEVLDRLASIDFLTGFFNHRFFQDRFDSEFALIKRHGRALSLIIIDIDHFKQVNDRYGHEVGDQILKSVSKRIRDNLRLSDIASRYGGEEFAILLPETDLNAARIVAEKLRKAVCESAVATDQESVQITISLGIAAFPAPDVQSRKDLFNKADQAMYRAKEAGRNRVEG